MNNDSKEMAETISLPSKQFVEAYRELKDSKRQSISAYI
jgi:hypothetical protein